MFTLKCLYINLFTKNVCMSLCLLSVAVSSSFVAMEELDGDEVRVSSRGRFAERDIVQVRARS